MTHIYQDLEILEVIETRGLLRCESYDDVGYFWVDESQFVRWCTRHGYTGQSFVDYCDHNGAHMQNEYIYTYASLKKDGDWKEALAAYITHKKVMCITYKIALPQAC